MSNKIGNLLWLSALLVITIGSLRTCTNLLDGSPQGKEKLAQDIILNKYPNFEKELQQKIRAEKPFYIGAYHYDFQKMPDQDNFIVVKYSLAGLDFLELINPFNRESTPVISVSFLVNVVNKDIVPVTCVPNDSWWSSQKTKCN